MINIYKLELIKFLKNPWSIIFGLLFPLAWTLVVGFVWGTKNVDGRTLMNFSFPAIVIMLVLTHSLSYLPITLSADRIEKRIKHLSLANISKKKYLFSLLFFSYAIFFCVFLLCFILSISLFHLNTNYNMVLSLFFIPIIIFLTHFLLSITISNFTKTIKTAILITFIILYFLLFTSGATIPAYVLPNWFQYLQYISPTGCAVIILTNCSNSLNQISTIFVYPIFICYTLVFLYFAFKYFSWD